MTLVVYSHLPGAGVIETGYPLHTICCVDNLDYWAGLDRLWGYQGDLVIVEHDMEFSDSLVAELVECEHALCTHAYELHHASSGKGNVLAQRVGRQAFLTAEYATGEWCDFTGIGFAKISPSARARPIAESHWAHLDVAVTRAVEGRWHIHRPGVDHHHW